MKTVNMHEAKTHLSRLVDGAVNGESFVIAKAGKPLVKVVPLDAPESKQRRRFGLLEGQVSVPDLDVWREMDKEIEAMFYGEDE